MGALAADPTSSVAHLIQTALTPVFLLSGIGTLLNVFNQRLARVSDHLTRLFDLLGAAEAEELAWLQRHMQRLRRRRLALDAAVALLGCAGVFTCAAAFALFLVTLTEAGTGATLVWLFGASLGCTIVALGAFTVDTVLGWHGLRTQGPVPRALKAAQAKP
jgi:hypothetical protein